MIFKNGPNAADQALEYFYESNSKNSARIWPRALQSFHFEKITGTLQIIIFFWKFSETFILQKNHQKENSKLNRFFRKNVGLQFGHIGFRSEGGAMRVYIPTVLIG